MSSPQQESFQSMATVFILQDKTWIERGSGLVRFVFDLRTFALRLVIRPGTPDEFECKLRPRIRSKGPRAYVVRAQAENGTDEHILAVRFEREEDSRSFRRFVEKRDVDHNQKTNSQQNQNANYNQSHLRNQTDYTNNSGHIQSSSNKYIDPMTAAVQQQHRYQNRASSNIQQGGYGSYGSNAHQLRNNNLYANNTASGMYANMTGNPNMSSPQNANKHHQVQANYFWTCSRCLQMVDPSLSSCHVCGKLRENPNHHSSNPNNLGNYGQPQQPQNVLQQISNPNNGHPSHPHHGGGGGGYGHPSGGNNSGQGGGGGGGNNAHNPHQQSTTHATFGSHHQINPASMTPSNRHNHGYGHSGHPSNHNQQSIVSPNGMQQSKQNIVSSSSNHNKSSSKTSKKSTVHILKLTTVNLEKHNQLFPPKRRNVKEIIQTQLEYLRTHQ